MAKGRISKEEQYIIEGMSRDGKTAEEIAVKLERSVMAVENHMTVLSAAPVDDQSAVVAQQAARIRQLEASSPDKNLETMKKAVYEKINGIPGLAPGTSFELVKRALAIPGQENPRSSTELYAWAMREIKAKELMGRQTANPEDKTKKTVAIMTKAASEKSDAFRKTIPDSTSRTARKNLYNISEDRIIDD